MKLPWWKKAWSYIQEVELERTSSDINPLLIVSLHHGSLQLSTEKAIYSYSEKYDNFSDTFSRMDLGSFNGKSLLILGFGLGSIPVILEQNPGFEMNITGVELDEVVIGLYEKYVSPDIRSSLEMITADAGVFMDLNQRRFDLIAVDVFKGDAIPEKILTELFCEQLKNALNEDGVVIWNHLYHYQSDRSNTDQFFEQIFKKVFPNAQAHRTRGNKMMLNKDIINN